MILSIIGYNIFMEIDDMINPSDSGDMMWLNYEVTKYKEKIGDLKSKWHLLAYYKYNDDNKRGEEIAGLIMDIINMGYGGLKNGGEGVVIDLIDECKKGRRINPVNVANAFELIKNIGGGLTALGQEIEARWQHGEFSGCPPLIPQ